MRKLFSTFFFISALFAAMHVQAQSTETFETELGGFTTFTDNGQVFSIGSVAGGPFDIQTAFAGTGWDGSGADSRYIDNDGFAAADAEVSFTISSASPFRVNSLWLFLADNSANVNVPGSVTLTGSLSGEQVFTATSGSGFNTNAGVNNGFSFIDLTTFGGSDNSAITIDELTISTADSFWYVALDAFAWTAAPAAPSISSHPTDKSICVNTNTTFSITATLATGYQWQADAGSGFANVSDDSVYANTTTATLSITGATASMNGYLYRCVANGFGSTNSNSATLIISNPVATVDTQTNVSCFGGSNGAASITVATGGIAPYTYNWTPGNPTGDGTVSVTDLTSAGWTVTFTDSIGCAGTQNFTITQPATLSSTAAAQTDVSCFGGSNGAATVSVSGGTGAYTYDWIPGTPTGDGTVSVTGLMAGSTTVTYSDANGCSGTRTFTIAEPAVLSSTGSQTDVTCAGNDGTASVNVSGGTGPYAYSWAPTGGTASSMTLAAPGSYTVTYTDSLNCAGTETFIIVADSNCTPTWTGTGNWSDPVWNNSPEASDSVVVQSGTLTVDTDATINDLTVETGTTIVVQSGNTLTVTGEFLDNGGTVTVQNGGEFVLEGEVKKNGNTRLRTFGKVKVMSGGIRFGN